MWRVVFSCARSTPLVARASGVCETEAAVCGVPGRVLERRRVGADLLSRRAGRVE